MSKKLVMGNEAVALGAILAGVNLVSGYPGTPSSEILETVAHQNPGDIYVEWSVNEKTAMEVAAGACYAGGRVMVTMKQVGLNVASDPLMSLIYVGTKGGMVVAVADDPGPISSQTEQDSRHFGKFANLPVFDPSTPEEAFQMVQDAFELSEEIKMPVMLRLSTRVCHACATLEIPEEIEEARFKRKPEGFEKSSDWVIFPALTYRKHFYIEEMQKKLAKDFNKSPFNKLFGSGKLGVAAGGNTYNYVLEAIEDLGLELKVLKIGTPNPFPEGLAIDFLTGTDKVLVVEELDGVIEENLILASTQMDYRPLILGKRTDSFPVSGEYSYELVRKALLDLTGQIGVQENHQISEKPTLPMRPPVLCAGCPHRASFYAVKKALKNQEAIFAGDIGCYTLGNSKPLDMVDTCLCMGAGITVAQGLYHMEPHKKCLSFIGDSTFFHTGLPGVVNAVYNQADITVIVLDNSTTAMTGNQPHPGIGKTMMNTISEKIDIYGLLKACGLEMVQIADPLSLEESMAVVKEAVEFKGPSAVIFISPCVSLIKGSEPLEIDIHDCTNCRKCMNEIGCPALVPQDDKVTINAALCNGCSLCEQICPFDAIQKESKLQEV